MMLKPCCLTFLMLTLLTLTHCQSAEACSDYCVNDPKSTGKTIFSCACSPGYIWSVTNLKCVRDCTRVVNANLSAMMDDPDICICKNNLYFDTNTSKCLIECDKIANTNGSSSATACKCISKFLWNPKLVRCEVTCSGAGVNKTASAAADGSVCVCLEKYVWNSTAFVCQVDCTLVGNTTEGGVWSATKCNCRKNFVWNTGTLNCSLTCSQDINYAASSKKLTDGNCNCKTNFYWENETDFVCVANCTRVFQSTEFYNQTDSTICECLNIDLYVWSKTYFKCTPICSLAANSTGVLNRTSNGEACNCKPGFTWNADSVACFSNT